MIDEIEGGWIVCGRILVYAVQIICLIASFVPWNRILFGLFSLVLVPPSPLSFSYHFLVGLPEKRWYESCSLWFRTRVPTWMRWMSMS